MKKYLLKIKFLNKKISFYRIFCVGILILIFEFFLGISKTYANYSYIKTSLKRTLILLDINFKTLDYYFPILEGNKHYSKNFNNITPTFGFVFEDKFDYSINFNSLNYTFNTIKFKIFTTSFCFNYIFDDYLFFNPYIGISLDIKKLSRIIKNYKKSNTTVYNIGFILGNKFKINNLIDLDINLKVDNIYNTLKGTLFYKKEPISRFTIDNYESSINFGIIFKFF